MKLKEKTMREIMQLKKVKPKDLAALLKISKGHLSNLLKGRRKLNMRCMKILIEFFGADLMSRAINWEVISDVKNNLAYN